MTIGFIGQGYIGKNYADDFERRGYTVVRYALEEPYVQNREAIKTCDIVFVAVPTPTTPAGFDASIVESTLSDVADGTIVVIKSTVVPGTTARLQEAYPKIRLLMSPEFLTETRAAHDAANPAQNIVGIKKNSPAHEEAAALVHSVLPAAPYALTTAYENAELIKYAHNTLGYAKLLFVNVLYDLSQNLGGEWEEIQDALSHDPQIAPEHLSPVHKTGRGAGGHCHIKDFAALREQAEKLLGPTHPWVDLMKTMEASNVRLLRDSGKDLELVEGVYGPDGP